MKQLSKTDFRCCSCGVEEKTKTKQKKIKKVQPYGCCNTKKSPTTISRAFNVTVTTASSAAVSSPVCILLSQLQMLLVPLLCLSAKVVK